MSDIGSTHAGQVSADGTAASLLPQAPPAWANLRLRSRAPWIALAFVILIGLSADQGLRAGTFGLAASVTLTGSAFAVLIAGGVKRVEPGLLLAAAAVFAVWFTIRASPWLLWPDLVASVALLGLAASFAVRGSMFEIGFAELAARAVHAVMHGGAGAAFVGRPIVASRGRFKAAAPLARGLIIAAPISALMVGLLASADPVFASFFKVNFDLGQLALDGVFVTAGSLWAAGLLRLASSEPLERVDGPAWRLGTAEALVVLAVLDAVFAAFALAQGLAVTGAADQTLRAAGVTYADYARSGFFQLLWVAGITLVVLVLFSRVTGFSNPKSRRAFAILAGAAIALTLLVVVVAFRRLSLYEEAYGFTMLRLYSHIFAAWIAVVFLLFAADLAGIWRRRRWFLGATCTTALALLLVLNFMNPEAIVVGLNISHAQSVHKIDASYLGSLSSDATPSLLASRSQVDTALRQQIDPVACAGPHSYSAGASAFNWSNAEAAAARRQACFSS